MIEKDILDNLILNLNAMIYDKKIDTSTASKIVVITMELIEKIKANISSEDKKKYVILAIKDVSKDIKRICDFENEITPEDVFKQLKFIIENDILDDMIDMICSASKGFYHLNKVEKRCFSCIGKLLS